ncbi:hypothetical protein R2J99_02215 [Limosilactobacillus reuteri]|uniref:hypothetical protein n=1 Tax=Limosilactobacillus reuteri TaxID=1598 RepID=UPI00159EF799|nr:hypothetical protein [Limosilactobacillus reuteri]MCC4399044.1 hypothetical protein [Limosilactobacillus reuteri]MCC4403740.1 hypothetical protein [Limosilactobacillus reuteri]MDL2057534.1 hypothetical protein [Limosilactobacillus reuteri]WPC94292.1 hypothetical protein R2J99_02215 [Limosilactobacillus reuteri]
MQNELTEKMSDQTSKLIEVAKSTRDIAYNNGLQADITNTRQLVDAMQKRQDTANVHMNEVTRQNEAMNADLKQIGPAIAKVVKAQNHNSEILNKALINGFHIHTNEVTESVANEFKKLTGFTINEFLQNEIIKQININVYEAKKAKLSAIQAAQVTEEVLHKIALLIQRFISFISVLVFELGLIIACAIMLPGWWKLIGLIVTISASAILNYYLKRRMDINGL